MVLESAKNIRPAAITTRLSKNGRTLPKDLPMAAAPNEPAVAKPNAAASSMPILPGSKAALLPSRSKKAHTADMPENTMSVPISALQIAMWLMFCEAWSTGRCSRPSCCRFLLPRAGNKNSRGLRSAIEMSITTIIPLKP